LPRAARPDEPQDPAGFPLEPDDQAELDPDAEPAADGIEDGGEPPPILKGERFLAVGFTGTGKSEAMLNPFAAYPGQRVLIDNQDHYEFGPVALEEKPPPLETSNTREIDWRHRTIRYVPARPGDRREMDRLYAAIFRRGNMLVCADELEDVAPSMGGGAPINVRRVLKQGRKVGITHGATTQRPVGIERAAINQANHLLAFPMVDSEDIRVISGRFGMTPDELADALNSLGQYEYLRVTLGDLDERRRPNVLRMPALPPETIEFTRLHVVNPEFSS
jgi:hypothetical protein